MKTLPFLFFLFFSCGFLCMQQSPVPATAISTSASLSVDSLLYQRFAPPAGFHREKAAPASFAFYLRHLPLKPPGSKVLLYDGRVKSNNDVYEAVVDLPIGKRDLHQCADAVIRLRAEYLWKTKQFNKIHFNLTNGFRVDYDRWRKGGRVKVTGNKTVWVQTAKASNTYATFWKYLEFVFSYAGTLSLSKELKSVPFADVQIGDVIIKGGSPGHAVIVVDIAKNNAGKKACLLAQSYMPAQEIQVLSNPAQSGDPVWYEVGQRHELLTPEWNFTTDDLKRFSDE